jgi:hypothetical protein
VSETAQHVRRLIGLTGQHAPAPGTSADAEHLILIAWLADKSR